MNHENVLNNLQKRNDGLKSKLLKEQLKYNNYSFEYFKKYSNLIINEYKQDKSLLKAALNIGIDQQDVLNWYIQGQLGNPIFRSFYLTIEKINNNEKPQNPNVEDNEMSQETSAENTLDGEFIISQYGDGWSYKTFINGEKIFIISNNLDDLKKKIKSKHLPLD